MTREARLLAYVMLDAAHEYRAARVARGCSIEAHRLHITSWDACRRAWGLFAEGEGWIAGRVVG